MALANSSDNGQDKYEKMANFMGRWPELGIFRRFSNLNVQNLLFLQAELAHLERGLHNLRRKRESSQDAQEKRIDQSWIYLSRPENNAEYSIILRIREKLKEYNEALAQYHGTCALEKPTTTDLEALRHWLSHETGGDGFLLGTESEAYDRECAHARDDLLTVSDSRSGRDLFTTFIADHYARFYQHNVAGKFFRQNPDDVEGGLVDFRDSRIHAISHFIGTLVASLLPAGCIFALYFIHSALWRLGAIMAFSAIFAFTLAIFTRARPIEIFAATAAFASVQVVFVGTSLGDGPHNMT